MFKLMGAILVIFSCTGFGMAKAAEERKRVEALYHLKGLLLLLRGEVQYARTPLAEAFGNLAEKDSGEFYMFLHCLSEQLLKMEGSSFEEIWKEEVQLQLPQAGLFKEDLEQLSHFGERLGYLDWQMQISTIDWQIEQIGLKLRKLEPAALQKQKIYRYVGVFSGLLIAVLLI